MWNNQRQSYKNLMEIQSMGEKLGNRETNGMQWKEMSKLTYLFTYSMEQCPS
jgi:hypothetical protein